MLEALERIRQTEQKNDQLMEDLQARLKQYEEERQNELNLQKTNWQETVAQEIKLKEQVHEAELNEIESKLFEEAKKEQMRQQKLGKQNAESVIEAILKGVNKVNGS